MSDPNDTNQGNVPNINETSEQSGVNNAVDAADKANWLKKVWKAIKANQAMAPLVTVILIIAAIIGIVFLAIGFVGFFITMPGLAIGNFLEASESLWDRMSGNEGIEVNKDAIINLANYIEDMGYDIEGFGFATSNSITRENAESEGKKGKIKDIDLDIDSVISADTLERINNISFLDNDSIKLQYINGQLRYPKDILTNANIVQVNNDGVIEYYKAVDSAGNNISFLDSNGNEKKFIVNYIEGRPFFTEDSSGKTFTELWDDEIKLANISYNHYKILRDNNKLGSYTEEQIASSLKGQEQFMKQFFEGLTTYDINADISNQIYMNTIITLKLNNNVTYDNSGINTYAALVLSHWEDIIPKLLDKEATEMDNIIQYFYEATGELVNAKEQIVEENTPTRKNLYAYILANERTYTAQGIKQNTGEWILRLDSWNW